MNGSQVQPFQSLLGVSDGRPQRLICLQELQLCVRTRYACQSCSVFVALNVFLARSSPATVCEGNRQYLHALIVAFLKAKATRIFVHLYCFLLTVVSAILMKCVSSSLVFLILLT